MNIVLGHGKSPCSLMFIGEAPGRVEFERDLPFQGPSGRELSRYLSMFGLSRSQAYSTNVCKQYLPDNPDPTPQQISYWTPTLLSELEEVSPQLIVCVGRFAAKFFLGEDCPPLDVIHGIPHLSNRPDLPSSVRSSIILPIFHTAAGLWNYERRQEIRFDFEQLARTLNSIDRGEKIHIRHNPLAGREDYQDYAGAQVEMELSAHESLAAISEETPPGCSILGLDTEGEPGDEWSIQYSLYPGHGRLLRTSQPDFSLGVSALQSFFRRHRPTLAMHQASTPKFSCYEVVMCRGMNLDLYICPWFDTMYNAYLYRSEPQSLKTLSYRWLDIRMEEYETLIEGIGRDKQIEWLKQAQSISASFPKPPKRHEQKNTGKIKVSQPKHISASIAAVLRDISQGKETKDGPTNPATRWEDLRESNPVQAFQVEEKLGKLPKGSLSDVPLEKAVRYACMDADATLRLALLFQERNATL